MQITVYLQALGGHFLGPHAYQTDSIRIKLRYSRGEVDLPYVLTDNSNDGNVSSTFTSGVSTPLPIITVPSGNLKTTAVNFLSPDDNTISGAASIPAPDRVELAELEVSVPIPSNQRFFRMTQQVILEPIRDLRPVLPSYKIFVPVPGLYLSEPKIGEAVSILVKMMCGCPITDGPPASLWPASDFSVYAEVFDNQGGATTYSLTYAADLRGNSLFSAKLSPNQLPIKSATFTALQKSTGNYGVLTQPEQG